MVFFHRLRLRWRERRLERKLRGVEAPRARASPEKPTQGIAIRRLRGDGGCLDTAKRNGTSGPTTTVLDARRGREPPSGDRMTRQVAVDESIVALVRQVSAERSQAFAEELAVLQAVGRVVPSSKHHIDCWVQRHAKSVRINVHTERDLARWVRTHLGMHEDLVRVRDLALWTARLELVDRKPLADTMDDPWAPDELTPTTRFDSLVRLPHPEICCAMVLAALFAGAYGLLILGVVLKLVRKI